MRRELDRAGFYPHDGAGAAVMPLDGVSSRRRNRVPPVITVLKMPEHKVCLQMIRREISVFCNKIVEECLLQP